VTDEALGAIVAGAAFVLTVGVRTLALNRVVRSKLRMSLALFLASAGLNLFLLSLGRTASATTVAQVHSIDHLVLALATINLLVAVLLNPLRADRVSDHLPNIVQDAIVIGLFLLVATFVMGEKFFTTSAVGAVVIGFALQDTLGNLFAGLAIQVEKPFRVGHWVSVGSYEGIVAEITWRATKLRTKSGNLVILPNNIISKEAISNFSEPAAPTRLHVDVGVAYGVPPNVVKAAMVEAVTHLPLVATAPPPEIVVADFGSSAIVYRVKFWIADYAVDDAARDQVRSAIYYMLRRRRIEIPYPIQVEYLRHETGEDAHAARRTGELDAILRGVDLLAPLSDDQIAALVETSGERLYASGEAIVRQGDAGDSMFVVCEGRVRVSVEPSGQEVATIEAGGYFGEMSMLTGDPRSATVTALGDCAAVEISAGTFRQLALAEPAIVEQVSLEVATRRLGLERARTAAAEASAAVETAPRSFLDRVHQFLRLPLGR
jgi:small-conductance mechanosensitive channel